jgi:hypothetical protein
MGSEVLEEQDARGWVGGEAGEGLLRKKGNPRNEGGRGRTIPPPPPMIAQGVFLTPAATCFLEGRKDDKGRKEGRMTKEKRKEGRYREGRKGRKDDRTMKERRKNGNTYMQRQYIHASFLPPFLLKKDRR